jgi:hypothetical protein
MTELQNIIKEEKTEIGSFHVRPKAIADLLPF